MISLKYKKIFQGDILQYQMYNVYLKVFIALPNACCMFHRSINSSLKAQNHKKRHKKKALNWLKLITKQAQVQVTKDLWY